MKTATRVVGSLTASALAAAAMAQPATFVDLGTLSAPQTVVVPVSVGAGTAGLKWYRVVVPGVSTALSTYLDLSTVAGLAPALSNNDSEIGVYDNLGALKATDDDDGAGNYSALSFGLTTPTRPLTGGAAHNGRDGELAAGTYWIAVGAFNTAFGTTAWNVTSTSTATGNVSMTINLGTNLSPTNPTVTGAVTPADAAAGATIRITATVVPGTNPTSSGITVRDDLGGVGGSPLAPMFDDGTNGDLVGGDNVWTLLHTLPNSTLPGAYDIAISVTDAQSRAASTTVTVRVDEAGDRLATAKIVDGSGTLTSIAGVLGVSDADIYKIHICDPANFSASTVGGTTVDSQLFLFQLSGVGIAMNDDEPSPGTTLQSRLTGPLVTSLTAGDYYLAISQYDKDPTDLGGSALWLDTPFNVVRAPDGLGALNGIWSWDTTTGQGGAYTIALTGASLEPCIVSSARAFGIGHAAVGAATLAKQADGALRVNIGGTGQDGVSFAYGDVQYGAPGFLVEPLLMQPGSGFIEQTFGRVNGIPNQLQSTLSATMVGNVMVGGADFGPVAPGAFVAQAWHNGQLVAENPNTPANGVSYAAQSRCGNGKKRGKTIDGCNQPGGGSGLFTQHVAFGEAADVTIAGTATTLADELSFCPIGGGSIGAISSQSVRAVGVPYFDVVSGGILMFDDKSISGLGEASIRGSNGTVVVENIGSSGNDGVSVYLGKPVRDWTVEWAFDPPCLDLAPFNAFATLRATGSVGGTDGAPLGEITFRKAAAFGGYGAQITVDFSAIGSPTHHIVVRSAGAVVADFPAHVGPVGTSSRFPLSLRKLGGPVECFASSFDLGTQFLIKGNVYGGDELLVLAENPSTPVDFKSGLSITAASLGFLTLFDITSTARCHGTCVADVDDGSSTGTPDGGVGIEDLLFYLSLYDGGVLCADVDDGSSTGTTDGGVGIEDLLYYLQRYDAGC